MARTKRTRRFRRPSRWSANIREFNAQGFTIPGGSFYTQSALTTNPTQSVLGVSQTYTCKNFKIDATIETSSAQNLQIEAVTVYVMYVPQGMVITENYNLDHPEYIMAYKYLGSPTNDGYQQYQPFRISTRLSRKLQTGDSVILFLKGYNESAESVNMTLNGLVRWWTKAN